MSELAFNVNGEPFEIPAGAVAWRVRKMKPKGAPEVAYGRNGQPLLLPIEADLDDLRAEVNAPGKYRLEKLLDLAIARVRAALPADAAVPPVQPIKCTHVPVPGATP